MVPAVSNLLIDKDYKSNNQQQRSPTPPQTFRDALAKSYTISEDFMSFCMLLLSFVERHYCHNCFIDPMNFVFAIWCVGVFMLSIGCFMVISGLPILIQKNSVVYFITCPNSLVVSFYLLTDGVLSVFFYPLLLANRPHKVDHTENNDLDEDQEESEDPRLWLAVLVVRSITLCIWSTVLPLYHSCCHQVSGTNSISPIFPNFCATHFHVAIVSILFGWVYILCILIPLLFCLLLFHLTPILIDTQLSMTALSL